MALKIPAEEFPALVSIVGLDDDRFNALIKAFEETVPSLSRGKYVAHLAAKTPGLEPEAISLILDVLRALYHIKMTKNISVSDISESIKEAATNSKEFGSRFAGKNGEVLRQRIKSLLGFDKTFSVLIKALNILAEHERVFCGSRILSDIRPIFTTTPETIDGTIISHSLQIGFHNSAGGGHQEVYFALDDEDLLTLKEAIERAQKKSIAIRALLKTSKSVHIDV